MLRTDIVFQRIWENVRLPGYECWTKKPNLSPWEQQRVAQVRAEEKRRGCKVNK